MSKIRKIKPQFKSNCGSYRFGCGNGLVMSGHRKHIPHFSKQFRSRHEGLFMGGQTEVFNQIGEDQAEVALCIPSSFFR
jgi:hypothetical protein